METIELTILEMYDVNALIYGFKNSETGFECVGFINEKNPELKESIKRFVSKVGKIIQAHLKDIEEQRKQIQSFTPEGKFTDEELAFIRKAKDVELLDTKEQIQIEKPLFSLVADLSLPNNYTFLYDKIFKD